jgi:DNA-binding MltR family transcriptional regulator
MPNPQERFASREDWEAFLKEFTTSDDRSCAILGASYVEFLLEQALRDVFVQDEEAQQQLLSDRGPLGTFSAKIELAYCLGLITKDERDDLNLIRKVRNDFAHKLKSLNFMNDGIRSRCLEMKLPREYSSEELGQSFSDVYKSDPKQIYMFDVFVLSNIFEIAFSRWAKQVYKSLSAADWIEKHRDRPDGQ